MRINFDFSDLEAFLAVKETGSFHEAGARLNLSQSAVTRRIHKLETVLDSQLFERTTRSVKPTLAAKRLQARAEAILEDARQAARAMRDESVAFAHQRGAVVTVASIATVLSTVVAPALLRFRAQGHNARVRLMDAGANDVAEAVASGEADFGICSIPQLEPNVSFAPLFDDPIVVALPADHPMQRQAEVAWEDLSNEHLALPARGTGNRMMIDETRAKAGQPLFWTLEFNRTSSALDLVAKGAAVALVPRSAVHDMGQNRVAWRPLVAPHISRPIGVITRLGQPESTLVSALKACITDVGSMG